MQVQRLLNQLLNSFFDKLSLYSPRDLDEEIKTYDNLKNILTIKHIDKNVLLKFIKKNYHNWKYLSYKLNYFILNIELKPKLYVNLFQYEDVSNIKDMLHSDMVKLLRYHIADKYANQCLSLYFSRINHDDFNRLSSILYLLVTNYQLRLKSQITTCLLIIHSLITTDLDTDRFYSSLNYVVTNIDQFDLDLKAILDLVYIFCHDQERYEVLISLLSRKYDEIEIQSYLSLLDMK